MKFIGVGWIYKLKTDWFKGKETKHKREMEIKERLGFCLFFFFFFLFLFFSSYFFLLLFPSFSFLDDVVNYLWHFNVREKKRREEEMILKNEKKI